MIPYGRQDINEDDINAVVEVLKSDLLTQGPCVPLFEQIVKDYCGSKFAIAMNSATSALHLSCLALGLKEGDIVWTSPISFVASSNCALYCGANLDFVDIDPKTYNISVVALTEKLVLAKRENRLPKILIPVHFAGQPCEMEEIYTLSRQYGFKIIEDASHAIGAKYKGDFVGNCKYSDITVFSLHPVKIITTAEGGLAVTNKSEYADMLRLLRSHGIIRDQEKMQRSPDGPWYYEQVALGYNYRLTDIQAALGVSQMRRLNEFIDRRSEIAELYDEKLRHLPLILPGQSRNNKSAWHLYVVCLRLSEIKKTHEQVFRGLRELGIGVNLHYIPIYRQPYYSKYEFQKINFPNAEFYYARAISLPIFPKLSRNDQSKVINSMEEVLN